MTPARRIGVFGGAFDPPHVAHVALAHAAVDQLGLDELRILPTGSAWHKARTLTDAAHRLAMARLAFADVPRALIDERELRRAGPTYTIDTLRELQAEQPGAQLALVIGADQAQAFDRWRESAEIARIAIISIADRPLQDAAPDGQAHDAGMPRAWRVPPGRWRPLALPAMPVSATAIRSRLAQGQGIDDLVPAPVARYIDQHHLYLPT